MKASTRTIPYFRGNMLEMPFLLMRHNATRRLAYFMNVHNPVSSGRRGNNDEWRAMAVNREIAAVNESRANSDVPVFLIGDMNDREKVFCPCRPTRRDACCERRQRHRHQVHLAQARTD